MDSKARAEFGEILVEHDILLDILSRNLSALDAYPHLKKHLASQHNTDKILSQPLISSFHTLCKCHRSEKECMNDND